MLALSITERGELPWVVPDPTSAVRFSGRVFDSVLRHLPNIGERYAAEVRHRAEQQTKGLDQRALMLIAGVVLTGLATGYGFQAYRAMQPFGASTQSWQPRRTQSRLSEFGQLGSMLSSAMGPVQPIPSGLDFGTRDDGGPGGRLVEVDAEVD
jgi:sorting and assembly machinery component 37